MSFRSHAVALACSVALTCTATAHPRLISHAPNGLKGDWYSSEPVISRDGRHVVFRSYATNLVAGDVGGYWDVFVYDDGPDLVERLSESPVDGTGALGAARGVISADGRHAAFRVVRSSAGLFGGTTSPYTSTTEVVLVDRDGDGDGAFEGRADRVTRVVAGSDDGGNLNDSSFQAWVTSLALSDDGRRLAYFAKQGSGESAGWALLLLDRDSDADGVFDEAGDTTTTTVAQGTFAEFLWWTPGFSPPQVHFSPEPFLSGDGAWLAFATSQALVAGDANGAFDTYLYRVSDGQLSRVAPIDVEPNGGTVPSAIAGDGSRVLVDSYASNLVAADTSASRSVFLWRRSDSNIALVSRRTDGTSDPIEPAGAALSADGTRALFVSRDNFLVADSLSLGVNGLDHMPYLYDAVDGSIRIYGFAPPYGATRTAAYQPGISGDGRFLVGLFQQFGAITQVQRSDLGPVDHAVTIGDAGNAVASAGLMTFPITVGRGTGPASSRVKLRLDIVMPADAGTITAAQLGGVPCEWAYSWGVTMSVECELAALAAGATSFSGSLQVQALRAMIITPQASLGAEQWDPDASDNGDGARGGYAAGLSFTGSRPSKRKERGDRFIYSFKVSNAASALAATSVQVHTYVPSRTRLISATVAGGSCSSVGTAELAQITCQLGTIAPGASRTVELKVRALTAGTSLVEASLSSATPTYDAVPSPLRMSKKIYK